MQLKLTTFVALLAAATPVFGQASAGGGNGNGDTERATTKLERINKKTKALTDEVTALTKATMPENGPKVITNYADIAKLVADAVNELGAPTDGTTRLDGAYGKFLNSAGGSSGISAPDVPKDTEYNTFVQSTKQLLLTFGDKCTLFRSEKLNLDADKALKSEKDAVHAYMNRYIGMVFAANDVGIQARHEAWEEEKKFMKLFDATDYCLTKKD